MDWLHKAGSAIGYYLPTASEPAVGLSGSPLKAGALWYDTTLGALKVWTGAAWALVFESIRKVISIGVWNMDTTAQKTVAHGLTSSKIRGVTGVIFNNAGTPHVIPCAQATDPTELCFDYTALGASITINRRTGGVFDGVQFNAATGYVIVDHVL